MPGSNINPSLIVRLCIAAWLAALAGCSSAPPPANATSACSSMGETSYDCQVERYRNVSGT